MNNKGQALVSFLIILPVALLIAYLVFNKIYLTGEKKNQERLTNILCDTYKKTDSISEVKKIAKLNDSKQSIKIKEKKNSIIVTLEKKGLFKEKIRTSTICE